MVAKAQPKNNDRLKSIKPEEIYMTNRYEMKVYNGIHCLVKEDVTDEIEELMEDDYSLVEAKTKIREEWLQMYPIGKLVGINTQLHKITKVSIKKISNIN